eukprot:5838911-Amphidinium_carterae.1
MGQFKPYCRGTFCCQKLHPAQWLLADVKCAVRSTFDAHTGSASFRASDRVQGCTHLLKKLQRTAGGVVALKAQARKNLRLSHSSDFILVGRAIDLLRIQIRANQEAVFVQSKRQQQLCK